MKAYEGLAGLVVLVVIELATTSTFFMLLGIPKDLNVLWKYFYSKMIDLFMDH